MGNYNNTTLFYSPPAHSFTLHFFFLFFLARGYSALGTCWRQALIPTKKKRTRTPFTTFKSKCKCISLHLTKSKKAEQWRKTCAFESKSLHDKKPTCAVACGVTVENIQHFTVWKGRAHHWKKAIIEANKTNGSNLHEMLHTKNYEFSEDTELASTTYNQHLHIERSPANPKMRSYRD